MASSISAGALGGAGAVESSAGAARISMLQQIQSQQGSRQTMRKIEKSAKEFESMLLSNWLQQAEQSMATVPGAEDDEDAAGRDQMMSLGVQSLATDWRHPAASDIGKMIAKALHACGR